MANNQVLEYIKSQYLACKQDWLMWTQDMEEQTIESQRNLSRKFADEAYAQANMLETMARDLFDISLFDWYLDQM